MDSGGGRLSRAGTDAVRNHGTDLLTATGPHAEGRGDVRVVKTVVNGGGDVTVGTSNAVTFPIAITITIKDNSGVKGLAKVNTSKA